jgi:hypothetical protein
MQRPWMRLLLGLLAASVLVRPGAAGKERDPLSKKVLAFATSKLGEKVGDGECWTLVFEALRAAGARLPGRDGVGAYDFGRKVKLAEVKPGDVLQFEKVVFEHRTRRSSYRQTLPHHTALVVAVKGREITLIHQNANNVKRVVQGTINLAHRKGGTIDAYRPVPAR